uniref:Reticulon domain-containing protein n=1 Tax=Aegilops tauschii subsp. strangulata TaxID=200361 RepID=A0A453LBR5_AEGTS
MINPSFLCLLTCYHSTAAADILLWRDEKKTFSYITLLFLLFYWFFLSDRTFVSSSAKILLVISLALYIHGVLPSKVYGFTVEKVTPDCFEVSDSTLRNPIMCMASLWNGGIHKLRVLAEGDDWGTFLKVCMQPVENTVLEDFFINVPNVVVSYFPVVLYNYLVSGSSGW